MTTTQALIKLTKLNVCIGLKVRTIPRACSPRQRQREGVIRSLPYLKPADVLKLGGKAQYYIDIEFGARLETVHFQYLEIVGEEVEA
ncbi:MAG: hypothetical protein KME45_02985 [Stenomitos rutilans HA7619-LM2]|jgi:hypothetical protein|nr:hypothetical protein [Stenomitos rutilans HA7619-LM2]MBW4469349.1 hypothetical protein [Stenomitos rutilans HA7619-LM2]